MFRPLPALMIGLALCAATAAPGLAEAPQPVSGQPGAAAYDSQGISILEPRVAADDDGSAYLYLLLRNASDMPVQIFGATSALSETVSLVEINPDDSSADPLPVEQISAPPGGEAELAPGGTAIQFDGGASRAKPGHQVRIELLTSAGPLDFTAPVEAAMPQ